MRKNPFWPFFPIIFVTRVNYLIQMIEKTASKWAPLATTTMDGGSAGFAGAKTCRFLFSDSLIGV